MSNSEMDRFAADYLAKPEMQAQFAGADNIEQVVSLAQAAGYDVAESDVQDYSRTLNAQSDTELTDAQLDAVSGAGGFLGALVNVAKGGTGLLGGVLNTPRPQPLPPIFKR